MLPPTASPARTALPAAHFDRKNYLLFRGPDTSRGVGLARWAAFRVEFRCKPLIINKKRVKGVERSFACCVLNVRQVGALRLNKRPSPVRIDGNSSLAKGEGF